MRGSRPRLVALLLLLLLLGSVPTLAGCDEEQAAVTPTGPVKEIKVAYDPGKAALFEELISSYNGQATVKVRGSKVEIPDMPAAVTKGDLTAISPDSAIWLDGIDAAWQEAHPADSSIVGTTVRYATTPVIIATWQGREGELGQAGERGWSSLLKRSTSDPNYRWSHGSPRASASGLLALVAEFYEKDNVFPDIDYRVFRSREGKDPRGNPKY